MRGVGYVVEEYELYGVVAGWWDILCIGSTCEG